jgi:hypothetical protein
MKSINNGHYGDNFYWFLGRVISDADPEFMGRVQVRVYGVHSDDQEKLPNAHLPWAQCLIPTTEGGVSGIGQHAKILPGALVFGFFMDGQSCQIPFVMGSIHHTELPIPGSSGFPKTDPDRFDPRQQPTAQPPASSVTKIDEDLVGGTNAEKIYNFFTNQGLTPAQAAGFIGNFYAESSLNSEAVNPNDKGKVSEGLAQWRGDRRDGLMAFAASNNMNYKSLTAQLNYVMHELRTTEKRAYGVLKTASTPKQAAIAICRFYERPSFTIVDGEYTSPSLNTRINAAVDAYRRFAR